MSLKKLTFDPSWTNQLHCNWMEQLQYLLYQYFLKAQIFHLWMKY